MRWAGGGARVERGRGQAIPGCRIAYLVLAAAVATALLVQACERAERELPSGPGVVLTVDPAQLPADGVSTARVLAVVARGLNSVQFSTSYGTISPALAMVQDGQATAILTAASTPGTAIVRAVSGGQAAETQVPIVDVPVAQLVLTATASSALADGVTRVAVMALVYNALGRTVPNGTPVTFLTSAGLLDRSIALTSGGIATANLQAPTYPTQAMVRAESGGVVERVWINFIKIDERGPFFIGQFSDTTVDGDLTNCRCTTEGIQDPSGTLPERFFGNEEISVTFRNEGTKSIFVRGYSVSYTDLSSGAFVGTFGPAGLSVIVPNKSVSQPTSIMAGPLQIKSQLWAGLACSPGAPIVHTRADVSFTATDEIGIVYTARGSFTVTFANVNRCQTSS